MSPKTPGDGRTDHALRSQPDAGAAENSSDATGIAHDQGASIGSLIRAALLDCRTPGANGDASGSYAHAYDGHVPLALDADILPAIDVTLDLLTTSTDLFEVPAFDFGTSDGSVTDA